MLDVIFLVIDFENENDSILKIIKTVSNQISFKKLIVFVNEDSQKTTIEYPFVTVKNIAYKNQISFLLKVKKRIDKAIKYNIAIVTNSKKIAVEIQDPGINHYMLDKNKILAPYNKKSQKEDIFIKPADFFNIIGNDSKLIKALRYSQEIILNNICTGVVINGSKGTGRTKLAITIAKIVSSNNSYEIVTRFNFMNKLNNLSHQSIIIKEIDSFSLKEQQNLLDLLNTNKIDTICTSSTNLQNMVLKDEFIIELYIKIAFIPLHLPDLKKRGDDIIMLAEFFLELHDNSLQFSKQALNKLKQYDWPLNITELKMIIKRIAFFKNNSSNEDRVIKSKDILLLKNYTDDGLKELGNGFSIVDELKAIEKRYIQKALKERQEGKDYVRELLGLNSNQTLDKKIDDFKLKPFPKRKRVTKQEKQEQESQSEDNKK